LLVDQAGIAEAIDNGIASVCTDHNRAHARELLERITVRYFDRKIRTQSGWVSHDARWSGGIAAFERGRGQIHYDEKWPARTRLVVASLLAMELRGLASGVAEVEDIEEVMVS
jgi:hypothetical protein